MADTKKEHYVPKSFYGPLLKEIITRKDENYGKHYIQTCQ